MSEIISLTYLALEVEGEIISFFSFVLEVVSDIVSLLYLIENKCPK